MFGNSKAVWNVSAVSVIVISLLIVAGNVHADIELGEPVNLGSIVNGPFLDSDSCISYDGLSLYFGAKRPGGFGSSWDIWVTTRESTDDEWGPARNLGSPINTSSDDGDPRISADGLTLFLLSDRPGGYGSYDIWAATRETIHDEWHAPVNLGSTINSSATDGIGSLSPDGLTLYLFSDRPGGYGGWDMYRATRETQSAAWHAPVNLGPTVNTSSMEGCPCVLGNGRILVFSSTQPGGLGGPDLYVTTWSEKDSSWSQPLNLGPTVNSPSNDELPSISYAEAKLYFSSNRPGGIGSYDLWQTSIDPVVDFTGDYRVDIEDLLLLIEHWGQDEPAYDMGPMPWGDGVADRADLEVLMSYYGQELYDPRFLAHWKLDETSGDKAYDIAGENHAMVIGDPIWQREMGQIGGAIQLDGINDYVATPFVLDPADSVFSVFVWIKGGGANQVILSQKEGHNWLLTDARGCLMTTLVSDGRKPGSPLYSDMTVTDGSWHRVGLAWDREYRSLYVDDELIAADVTPQDNLPSNQEGLYIGVDGNRKADTFWSGLIDDVRIYGRVVEP